MKQENNNDRILTILICTFAIIFGTVFKLMPSYYYWHGQNYYKKQDYVKAHKNFKNAYVFNKHNKDYRYYYVKTLLNLSPCATVQKELFEIASSPQQDSAQQIADRRINKWRNEIITSAGDNYIEQVPLDKGIIRWNEKKFPLKVAIVDASDNKNLPLYYRTEIIRAFGQWQAATDFINFAMTNSTESADILIRISPTPNDMCSGQNCRYVVGFTTPDYKGTELYNMTITLYTHDPFGNFFSDKELYNTILHEIGHALGIMGHSYSSEDLMYMTADDDNSFYAPYRSSFQYLSSKDVNTVKLLYKLIPDITNTPLNDFSKKGLIYAPIILGTSTDISSRKLKEAKNYIKNAPEIAGGYIDLGIAYAELNKQKEALKAMSKAYELAKSDNEKYMITYNLAVMNMNKGDLDAALKYAREAKELYNSEEIKDLIMNIKHAKLTNKKSFKGTLLKYSEDK